MNNLYVWYDTELKEYKASFEQPNCDHVMIETDYERPTLYDSTGDEIGVGV